MIKMRIEQTLLSVEVAEMVEKPHNDLLKDIRRYCKQLGEGKISQSDFFTESTYQNRQNKTMPCYKITKKGCEFIAHKLTGTKGTAFTAKYINRFHGMEKELQQATILIEAEQQKNTTELLAKALLEANKMLQKKEKQLVEKENDILHMRQIGMFAGTQNRVEQYKNATKDYIERIRDVKRLATIHTIVKRSYEYEVGIRKPTYIKGELVQTKS